MTRLCCIRSINYLAVALILLAAPGCQNTDSKLRINPTIDTESPTLVLIPNNLKEAFAELDTMLTEELKEEIKGAHDKDFLVGVHHFGLCAWLRGNWGLWGQGVFATWFKEKGINHADDMSSIILVSYWRYLNSEELKVEEQVAYYKQYWLENTPPELPCPKCGENLDWTGGGGEFGHGLSCHSCGTAYHYFYRSGLRELPVSLEKASQIVKKLMETRELAPSIAIGDQYRKHFKEFAAKGEGSFRFTFDFTDNENPDSESLVWRYSIWGQNISKPHDNRMWMIIDAETSEIRIDFLLGDPFEEPTNSEIK